MALQYILYVRQHLFFSFILWPRLVQLLAKLCLYFCSVIAETSKNAGNDAFHEDDFVKAINLYTEGIEVKCEDEDLNAKLYNNRASAHYHLGKYHIHIYVIVNIGLNSISNMLFSILYPSPSS